MPQHDLVDPDHRFALPDDLSAEAETLIIETAKTIGMPRRERSRASTDSLPRVDMSQRAPGGPSPRQTLILGPVLGEGGMGQVHLATQLDLGREVAVKSLKPADHSAASLVALLDEARVMGQLEHPNVIPVHLLGRDEAGRPLLVMKRVEGVTWSAYLDEREAREQGVEVERDVRWHLEVLLKVCHAIHYAHSRGLVHRDLKPSNVMIGAFGQVYVLDWGLAASIAPHADQWAPPASDQSVVVGTPHYMPPEMAEPSEFPITVQTDVYLLGAILHEILAGQPPHTGKSLHAILIQAYASAPKEYGPEVHDEIARICRQSMERDPRRRHTSVEALRQEIADYLEHRSAIELASQTDLIAARFDQLLERESTSPPERAAIRGMFEQARFGYRQSLRLWADHAHAREALCEMSWVMASREIDWDQLGAARTLITDAPGTPPAALVERLERTEREQANHQKEHERLLAWSDQMDTRRGRRARALISFALALFWGFSPLTSDLLDHYGVATFDHTAHVFAGVRAVVISALLMIVFRKKLWRSVVTRAIVTGFMSGLMLILCMRLIVLVNRVALAPAIALEMCLDAFLVLMFALLESRRAVLSAVIYVLGAFGVTFWPARPLLWLAGTGFVAISLVAWALWSDAGRDMAAPTRAD